LAQGHSKREHPDDHAVGFVLGAMASSDEAAEAVGELGATIAPADASGQMRRRGSKQKVEIVDELAQETKRVTLLDREEAQLKGRAHSSRLLFVFNIVDDKATHNAVDREFAAWRKREEGGTEVTGLLLFVGQAAVSFLEGPTELLFKAMELFHGLTMDVEAGVATPLPPKDVRVGAPAAPAPVPIARAALIGVIRVLYFTELHGVRTSVGWCSFASPAKTSSTTATLEDGASELVFSLYRKLLVVCLKAQESAGEEATSDVMQGHYRRNSDFLPLPEEAMLLLGKTGSEYFFSFTEFQKVFMKPFQLVLNSELLWPMPPALSY